MPKVFIVSDSGHDFSSAEKFGELTPLSRGLVNRNNANHFHRIFSEGLANSSADDYLLLSGLSVMNSIACAVFTKLHSRLNLLLFNDGVYLERRIIL